MKGTHAQRDLPSPGLGQAKTRSLQLHPGLLQGKQGLKYKPPHYPPSPRIDKQETGLEAELARPQANVTLWDAVMPRGDSMLGLSLSDF